MAVWDHPRSRGEYRCHGGIGPCRRGSSPLSRGIRVRTYTVGVPGGIIPALAGNTPATKPTDPLSPDHPRSRGEYFAVEPSHNLGTGSSPLSRGILLQRQYRRLLRGIIPALAGNTGCQPVSRPTVTDHPRSRGEYRPHSPVGTPSRGSSPLSRGIRLGAALVVALYGIIPALAGNTLAVGQDTKNLQDHPRSRGEYKFLIASMLLNTGSSPLSRGIRRPDTEEHCGARIIPALAGNTGEWQDQREQSRDHPRSRGEYHDVVAAEWLRQGSSPLSRGIPAVALWAAGIVRIIPALAGNTRKRQRVNCRSQDHPRSRGEYHHRGHRRPRYRGSSPLSRGIRVAIAFFGLPFRIIPALAGNTSSDPLPHPRAPDHPRSRGEYLSTDSPSQFPPGSSPLSRGIPQRPSSRRSSAGIIPALAGNTEWFRRGELLYADHPRSRGEYSDLGGSAAEGRGSSPLSRGIPVGEGSGWHPHGIIPALAGNTAYTSPISRAGRDHPRSRGEYCIGVQR